MMGQSLLGRPRLAHAVNAVTTTFDAHRHCVKFPFLAWFETSSYLKMCFGGTNLKMYQPWQFATIVFKFSPTTVLEMVGLSLRRARTNESSEIIQHVIGNGNHTDVNPNK